MNKNFSFPCFNEFIGGMINRLIMGRLRYGAIEKLNYDMDLEEKYKKLLDERWKLFKETLNLEYLLDIANFALILYVIGKHLNRKINPMDRRWR